MVEKAVLDASNALMEQTWDIAAGKASGDAMKAARGILRAHKRYRMAQDEVSAAAALWYNVYKEGGGRSYWGSEDMSGSNCGRSRVFPRCSKTPAAAEAAEAHLRECTGI